jgi:HSP20 family protein
MEVWTMVTTPYAPFVGLRQAMEQLVDESLVGAPFRTAWSRAGNGTGSPVAQPIPLDVYATEEAAVVVAAVPGLRPEDLELTVHQDTVTLSGTVGNVADTEEAKGATWYVHELWSGQFRRGFTLPFPVDADQAEANFDQGILKVVLPKAATAKPTKIAIGGPTAQAIESGSGSGGKRSRQ